MKEEIGKLVQAAETIGLSDELDFRTIAEHLVTEKVGPTIMPDQDTIVKLNEVQLERAKAKLKENQRKELEEVDPRVMFLKLKQGFLEQYGRINAAITACDTVKSDCNSMRYDLKSMQNELNRIAENNRNLNRDMEVQANVLKELLLYVEKVTTPWYIKVWNRIKRK
ncbi:MAG TPA: hypothetical protein VI911_11235 [Patescibacteria group bacterium]|nr:hypothetical protein [Patescibacteria group bacterium]